MLYADVKPTEFMSDFSWIFDKVNDKAWLKIRGSNGGSYPAGSNIYLVGTDPHTMYTSPENTRMGEIFYGHNNYISNYINTSDRNDWQSMFNVFYESTHGTQTRGLWEHDTALYQDMDDDGYCDPRVFHNWPDTHLSAGWGLLRYGGSDHRRYDESWEKAHLTNINIWDILKDDSSWPGLPGKDALHNTP